MKKSTLLPLLGLSLALAACSSNESPEPGQYKQTVKITTLDFPGLTEQAKQQTIAQMERAAGGGTGGLFCMQGQDNGEQWKQAASQMSGVLGGDCTTIKDAGTATTIDLEMKCTGTGKGDIAVIMTGKAHPEGFDSTMSFDIKDPNSDATAKLAMDISAQRQGDCPS